MRQEFDQSTRAGALTPGVCGSKTFLRIQAIEGKADQCIVGLLAAFEKRHAKIVMMKASLMSFEFLYGQVVVMLRIIPFAQPFRDFPAEYMIGKQD